MTPYPFIAKPTPAPPPCTHNAATARQYLTTFPFPNANKQTKTYRDTTNPNSQPNHHSQNRNNFPAHPEDNVSYYTHPNSPQRSLSTSTTQTEPIALRGHVDSHTILFEKHSGSLFNPRFNNPERYFTSINWSFKSHPIKIAPSPLKKFQ